MNRLAIFQASGWLLAASGVAIAAPQPQPQPLPCPAAPAEMACIPGGWFVRGSRRQKNERPVMRVFVQTFLLDRYEVTNADYRACIKAGRCRRAGPNYRGFSAPRQPIVGVNWYDARDYCRYRAGRLPSEAEWERAARGDDGDRYPWGNRRPSCRLAVIKAARINGCGRGKTWPVGSRPPQRYGLYDMAGNSWEWVADWYSPNYHICGAACAGVNPKGPCGGADECPGYRRKIVKGGSWYWPGDDARGARRRPHVPANRPFHHFGFRCARSLPANR
ncbi:MAG: SUMF1/EgtB/PvdO family nonheme iron enzyme [Deltaproteobacteria bacterium]|nr:SUMF1/EgtB/PvdO family nonheme iron enzyme [Deltaproteobacteria bacterium]